jgi:hypothetical protein
MLPTEKRRPDDRDGALKIAGRRIAHNGTSTAPETPAPCPLACAATRCPWRCPGLDGAE